MSEPETLDTDEPLARRIERHQFDRLIMLSDGVFAIAMTLLALEVRPPQGWTGELADLLGKTWRSLFGLGLTFLITGSLWFANRAMLARVRRVDGPFTALTLLFLCVICLAPFATGLMAMYGPLRSMKVYALFIGGAGLVQAALWAYAAFPGRLLDPAVGARERWATLASLLAVPVMMSLCALLIRPGASIGAIVPVLVLIATVNVTRRRLARRAATY